MNSASCPKQSYKIAIQGSKSTLVPAYTYLLNSPAQRAYQVMSGNSVRGAFRAFTHNFVVRTAKAAQQCFGLVAGDAQCLQTLGC